MIQQENTYTSVLGIKDGQCHLGYAISDEILHGVSIREEVINRICEESLEEDERAWVSKSG